jgi:hypothetical protein
MTSLPAHGRWAVALVALLPLSLAAGREPTPEVVEALKKKAEAAQARQLEQHRQQVLKAQRPQIEQMTGHFETQFRPCLWAELDRARRTCGDLPAEARRAVAAAGTKALQATARQFAEQQFGARPHQPLDIPASIQTAVAAALKPVASAEAVAAYDKEHVDRRARLTRAAQLMIVMYLDDRLMLVDSQRKAIAADLEQRWQPAWNVAASDQPFLNNQWPAPDYAAECIAPHLDDRQQAVWKTWCEQAGSKKHNLQVHAMNNVQFSHDNALQADPWWSP